MVDEMCDELQWYVKLLMHVGAFFNFLTLPIQIPICVGVYVWYYVREGKDEADAFWIGVSAGLKFIFHHNIRKMMNEIYRNVEKLEEE